MTAMNFYQFREQALNGWRANFNPPLDGAQYLYNEFPRISLAKRANFASKHLTAGEQISIPLSPQLSITP